MVKMRNDAFFPETSATLSGSKSRANIPFYFFSSTRLLHLDWSTKEVMQDVAVEDSFLAEEVAEHLPTLGLGAADVEEPLSPTIAPSGSITAQLSSLSKTLMISPRMAFANTLR